MTCLGTTPPCWGSKAETTACDLKPCIPLISSLHLSINVLLPKLTQIYIQQYKSTDHPLHKLTFYYNFTRIVRIKCFWDTETSIRYLMYKAHSIKPQEIDENSWRITWRSKDAKSIFCLVSFTTLRTCNIFISSVNVCQTYQN